MNGTTEYSVVRIIDGVKVVINLTATPVGQAPNPSQGLGLVRQADGADGRELVNIIGDAIDGVLEALERPEHSTASAFEVPGLTLEEIADNLSRNPGIESYVDWTRSVVIVPIQ